METFKEFIIRTHEVYLKGVRKSLARGLPNNPSNFYTSCANSTFPHFAYYSYLVNDDVREFKNFMYNSVVSKIRVHEIYDSGKVDQNYLLGMMHLSSNIKIIHQGVLSENKEILNEFLNKVGGRPEFETQKYEDVSNNYTYTLKYLLLGDRSKTEIYLKKMMKSSDKKYNRGLYDIIHGILIKDSELLQNGLEIRLKKHRQSKLNKGTANQYISNEVLSFLKIAEWYGINISIDDPLVPNDLLQSSDVEYKLHDLLMLDNS